MNQRKMYKVLHGGPKVSRAHNRSVMPSAINATLYMKAGPSTLHENNIWERSLSQGAPTQTAAVSTTLHENYWSAQLVTRATSQAQASSEGIRERHAPHAKAPMLRKCTPI